MKCVLKLIYVHCKELCFEVDLLFKVQDSEATKISFHFISFRVSAYGSLKQSQNLTRKPFKVSATAYGNVNSFEKYKVCRGV